jgi:hypothetical protein
LKYSPRPVFQSYIVFSHPLVELNRRHLQSERAADNVIFDVETLDGRVPALQEGQLWPDVLSRYRVAGMTNNYVLLSKRSEPIAVDTLPVSSVRTTWFKWLDVPKNELPLWVSIKLHRTALGTFLNILYKPPLIHLRVIFEDGKQEEFRVIPDTASVGFVLNPFIRSKEDFYDFMTDWRRASAASRAVARVAITGQTGVTWAYGSEIEVQFGRLCVSQTVSSRDTHSARSASTGKSCDALRAG